MRKVESMKEFDVLVVGELNVDIILDKINGQPVIGKEILAENFNCTLGSSSAIFASNLSTLGSKVNFIGKVGKDHFANVIKEALDEKHVDTSNIIESTAYSTGSSIILNYDMDRAIVTYSGAMSHLDTTEISDAAIAEARHMHVSSVFLQTAIKENIVELFKRAKSLGVTTSIDPQWDPAEEWDLDLKALLPYVDVFLPNRSEFLAITKKKSLQEGLDSVSSFANIIVIKDGEKGSHLWANQELVSKPAYLNSKVADCIGAGDSFDAGFINQFVNKKALSDCLEYGTIMGAINTTKSGGTGAFSSLDNVLELAKEKFNIA